MTAATDERTELHTTSVASSAVLVTLLFTAVLSAQLPAPAGTSRIQAMARAGTTD